MAKATEAKPERTGEYPAAPKPAKRQDVQRTRLFCTAGTGQAGESMTLCDYKTAPYPDRDLGTARKELGEHAVQKHSIAKRIRIVTERREEVLEP